MTEQVLRARVRQNHSWKLLRHCADPWTLLRHCPTPPDAAVAASGRTMCAARPPARAARHLTDPACP